MKLVGPNDFLLAKNRDATLDIPTTFMGLGLFNHPAHRLT